jgi:hypothetical protein
MKIILLSILTVLAPVALHAQCAPPDGQIDIPDGSVATLDQMKAAQQAVKAFNAAVTAYTACLQDEEAAKIKEGGDKKKIAAEYAKRNDAEVDKLQQVADKFNNELKAFKAKPPG